MKRDVDYIIVGLGLAGLSVAEHLLKRNKRILVIDPNNENASKVAGGMYNPIILKRFTLAWNADKHMKIALPFYRNIEDKLDVKVIKNIPVYRRFHSVEEQNNWFEASDKPNLAPFLSPDIKATLHPKIDGQHGFGKVNSTGTIDTITLLNAYRNHLNPMGFIEKSSFDYEGLQFNDDGINYNKLKARGIIFCEGVGVKNNPFFNTLDIRGNKGEYLIIESKDLDLQAAVKSSIFIIPLGNNHYKVGASYDRTDQTLAPTKEKKKELIDKLDKLLTAPYSIVNQVAGIRPTTKDRKPFVGRHPEHKSLFICNGLGSRGVLTAPTVALELVNNILDKTPISSEIKAFR